MNMIARRGAFVALLLVSTAVYATPTGPLTLQSFVARKNLPKLVIPPSDVQIDAPTSAIPTYNSFTSPAITVGMSFEGTSDYDTRALGIGLIPPDTMGAVGTTQYVQLINGSFSVYNKSTGLLAAPRITDSAFWTGIGGGSTGGDPRILFDSRSSRWLAIGFDSTGAGLRIGVSDTDNALGGWKSARIDGFAPGIADYPTLSMSGNAVLIGTNDFTRVTGGFAFAGTTINVLNYKSVFAVGGPDVSGLKQLTTRGPFDTIAKDSGYAIQGVNRDGGGGPATVVAASLFFDGEVVTYDITAAGTPAATRTAQKYLSDFGSSNNYTDPNAARQPTLNGSAAVVDALDQRISANAWEMKGKIYFLHTVKPLDGNNDVVRIVVLDKATGNVLSETDITDASGNYDFYQGSLAVNSSGQVLVGFNRSGTFATGSDGKISVFARAFITNADGTLTQTAPDVLLKQSLVSDYHNGSAEGQNPVGRQRWGDYSSVTLDPTNKQSFWVTGEFAREYNNTAGGHPGGSGFGRWGTWVAEVTLSGVPEPSSWAMMIAGFGLVGAVMRRRRQETLAAA